MSANLSTACEQTVPSSAGFDRAEGPVRRPERRADGSFGSAAAQRRSERGTRRRRRPRRGRSRACRATATAWNRHQDPYTAATTGTREPASTGRDLLVIWRSSNVVNRHRRRRDRQGVHQFKSPDRSRPVIRHDQNDVAIRRSGSDRPRTSSTTAEDGPDNGPLLSRLRPGTSTSPKTSTAKAVAKTAADRH